MGEIAPEEQFLPFSTIFCYLMLDFYVKTGIRFSLRDRPLFEITEVEITRVDCISKTSSAENERVASPESVPIHLNQTGMNLQLRLVCGRGHNG